MSKQKRELTVNEYQERSSYSYKRMRGTRHQAKVWASLQNDCKL